MKPFRFLLIACLLASFHTRTVAAAEALLPPKPAAISAADWQALENIAKVITAGSYVAGIGMALGAITKFHAHRDNPTQVPISMPITLLFVAAALLFLPSIFHSSGSTLFGDDWQRGLTEGLTPFDYALVSGVVTSKVLEHGTAKEDRAGLRDALEFLVSLGAKYSKVNAEDRAEAVLIGALVGIGAQSSNLSRGQREEIATLVTRATVSEMEQLVPAKSLFPDVEDLVAETIRDLPDLHLSIDDEIDYAGRIVRGAEQALANGGLPVKTQVELLDHFVATAVRALRRSNIPPTDLDRAVATVVRSALDNVYANDLTTQQYAQATAKVLYGAMVLSEDGYYDFDLGREKVTLSKGPKSEPRGRASEPGLTLPPTTLKAVVDTASDSLKRLEEQGERGAVDHVRLFLEAVRQSPRFLETLKAELARHR